MRRSRRPAPRRKARSLGPVPSLPAAAPWTRATIRVRLSQLAPPPSVARPLPDGLRDVRPVSVAHRRDGSELFYCGGDGGLYRHRPGTPQSADRLLWREAGVHYLADVSDDDRYLVATSLSGSDVGNGLVVWELADDAAQPIALGAARDALLDLICADGNRLWLRQEHGRCPHGRIVTIDLHDPSPDRWREVVEQSADPLTWAVRVGDRLIVHYLRDCSSWLVATDLDGASLGDIPLPGVGTVLAVESGSAADELLVEYTDFLTPPTAYRCDLSTGTCGPAGGPGGVGLAPDQYTTRQAVVRGRDGTRVSVFVTHRRDLPLAGDTPTYLTGYGGFAVSTTPVFSPDAVVWMEMGGVWAVVNARGGGEYGRRWHQAAVGRHKQRAFDDCLAVAEWLVAERYTAPARLAVGGTSNGGLVAAACLTQRPELFAAAVVDAAPLDMLGFDRLGVGAQWVCEYGSPADAGDRAALAAYSPLHNVRDGVRYPSTLVATASRDPLVDPSHSRSFAARLRAASTGAVRLRVYDGAEHAPTVGTARWLDRAADRLAFLAGGLGVAGAWPG